MESFGRDSCSSLVFHTKEAGASSIVSEWGLVCDFNYKSKVSTVYQYNLHSNEGEIASDGVIKVVPKIQGTMSAFMAGVMIGAFLLGKLADGWEILSCVSFQTQSPPGLAGSIQSPSPCLASSSSTPSLVSPAPSTFMLELNLQLDSSALETSWPCLSFPMSWWVGQKGPLLEQLCRSHFWRGFKIKSFFARLPLLLELFCLLWLGS